MARCVAKDGGSALTCVANDETLTQYGTEGDRSKAMFHSRPALRIPLEVSFSRKVVAACAAVALMLALAVDLVWPGWPATTGWLNAELRKILGKRDGGAGGRTTPGASCRACTLLPTSKFRAYRFLSSASQVEMV